MRYGLYPMISKIKSIKPLDIRSFTIYNFLNNENVEIYCKNAKSIKDKFKNDKKCIPNNFKQCNIIVGLCFLDINTNRYNGFGSSRFTSKHFIYTSKAKSNLFVFS